MYLRERCKWWFFPGLNLNARLRLKVVRRKLGAAGAGSPRTVLDAGCGNGALAFEAYRRGNRVVAFSNKEGEIARNIRLFNGFLRIPTARLSFVAHDLYDLAALGVEADEIVCTEVLEHVKDDRAVCRLFHDVLKPGGTLHLCCPNAAHPRHRAGALDEAEAGGHVRHGYTVESYRALLEPLGFQVEESVGIGGPVRERLNRLVVGSEKRFGLGFAFPLFLLVVPLTLLDTRNPAVPFSLYVRARKPAETP